MPLGTRDLSIIEGDLVKVTSRKLCERHLIPIGTIGRISRIMPGKRPKYQLEGLAAVLNKSEIELVSYIRKPLHIDNPF